MTQSFPCSSKGVEYKQIAQMSRRRAFHVAFHVRRIHRRKWNRVKVVLSMSTVALSCFDLPLQRQSASVPFMNIYA